MKNGGKALRRSVAPKGPHKQSRAQALSAARKRQEQRRTLLRRGQPPRALRSIRTTQGAKRSAPTLTGLRNTFRRS